MDYAQDGLNENYKRLTEQQLEDEKEKAAVTEAEAEEKQEEEELSHDIMPYTQDYRVLLSQDNEEEEVEERKEEQETEKEIKTMQKRGQGQPEGGHWEVQRAPTPPSFAAKRRLNSKCSNTEIGHAHTAAKPPTLAARVAKRRDPFVAEKMEAVGGLQAAEGHSKESITGEIIGREKKRNNSRKDYNLASATTPSVAHCKRGNILDDLRASYRSRDTLDSSSPTGHTPVDRNPKLSPRSSSSTTQTVSVARPTLRPPRSRSPHFKDRKRSGKEKSDSDDDLFFPTARSSMTSQVNPAGEKKRGDGDGCGRGGADGDGGGNSSVAMAISANVTAPLYSSTCSPPPVTAPTSFDLHSAGAWVTWNRALRPGAPVPQANLRQFCAWYFAGRLGQETNSGSSKQ